jgi:hypothetical protein
MLQLLAVLQAKALHHLGHAFGRAEIEHQLVLEADEEDAFARIALAGAAAAQLAVGAARFMAFGADDEQAAEFGHTRRRV